MHGSDENQYENRGTSSWQQSKIEFGKLRSIRSPLHICENVGCKLKNGSLICFLHGNAPEYHIESITIDICNVFVFGCFDMNRSDSFLTFLLNNLRGRSLSICFPHFNTIMIFGKISCVFFHWLICCTHKVSHICVGAARKV